MKFPNDMAGFGVEAAEGAVGDDAVP